MYCHCVMTAQILLASYTSQLGILSVGPNSHPPCQECQASPDPTYWLCCRLLRGRKLLLGRAATLNMLLRQMTGLTQQTPRRGRKAAHRTLSIQACQRPLRQGSAGADRSRHKLFLACMSASVGVHLYYQHYSQSGFHCEACYASR